MFAFQLTDGLTGKAKIAARHSGAAFFGDNNPAAFAFNRESPSVTAAGIVNVALEFFFNALLYEVHRVSH